MQSPGVVGGAPIRALSLDTSPPIRDAQVTFIYHTTGATRSRVVKKDQLESVKDPAQAGTSDGALQIFRAAKKRQANAELLEPRVHLLHFLFWALSASPKPGVPEQRGVGRPLP